MLVVFVDGSELGFGATMYIRWKLAQGGWWVTLVLSKGKIAPKNRISIPRLELCGAIVGEVEKVVHLVDSSTVLGYLHKQGARLKTFEGIRMAEVQEAGKFVNRRLEN